MAEKQSLQASVRSLPQGKLQNLRCMFDKNTDTPNPVAAEVLMEIKHDSRIANEQCDMDASSLGQERSSKCLMSVPCKAVPISEQQIEKGPLHMPKNRSEEVTLHGKKFREHVVIKVTDKSDISSCDEITLKFPPKTRISSQSPSRFSPLPFREKDDLLENSEAAEKSSEKRRLDVVSVCERSRLFEPKSNPLSVVSSQGSNQLKAHPPARKKLSEEIPSERPSCTRPNSSGKVPPQYSPLKRNVLAEKQESAHTNSDLGEHFEAENTEISTNKKPLMPPVKPRRTGAHDDYILVKKQKALSMVTFNIEDHEPIDKKNKRELDNKDDANTSSEKILVTKAKPLRPPPPLDKPRPYSIASNGCNLDYQSSDSSDSGDDDSDSLFYEVTPNNFEKPMAAPIQHWDLPRSSHPEPIKRSRSAECIQKAIDEEGKIVYLDSSNLLGQRNYDIYIDSEGYAIPNRVIKRKGSIVVSAEPSKPIRHRMKSKIKRFKNFFTDSPDSEKITTQSNPKAKLRAIRHKINQAFEILNSSFKQTSTWECDVDSAKKQLNEMDSQIEDVKVQKHIDYCQSVRIKTSQSIKESRKLQDKVYPQLFEHAMIVGLELNHDTGVYKPYIIYKFPEIKKTDPSVPLFCFPDAANFKPSSSTSKGQSYNFVLTHMDAKRLYGYCRRFVPPKSPNKTPEVICIISPVDAFMMYNMLLEQIEKKRLLSLDAAQEMIAAAFGRPLPQPGKAEAIKTLDEHGEMEIIYLNRGTDSRWENFSCERLLTALGSELLLKVFSTMLLERSILFCARHLSTLSSTIHALASLLYPLSWQHTFIPVLPSEMLEVICSPSPYIIGITASLAQKALSLAPDEHVLVVDIDKKSLLKSQGDEKHLLPPKILKALKMSLNMCKIDADAKRYPDIMISEAFLRFFVEAIGHYGNYIVKQGSNQNVFQKEEFVKGARTGSLRGLVEWLVETQMFDVFITQQIEKPKGNTIEYFETLVKEHKFASQRKLGQKETPAT